MPVESRDLLLRRSLKEQVKCFIFNSSLFLRQRLYTSCSEIPRTRGICFQCQQPNQSPRSRSAKYGLHALSGPSLIFLNSFTRTLVYLLLMGFLFVCVFCFVCTTTAELGTCDRHYMAHKT